LVECRAFFENHALKIINEGGQKLSYTQDFFTIQGGDKAAGKGDLSSIASAKEGLSSIALAKEDCL